MAFARQQRFRVGYGASTAKALCQCGMPYYAHRPKGGACYAQDCSCAAFSLARVNPNHRWSVAPRKTTVFQGHKYDSLAEADYAAGNLERRLLAGDIAWWKPHPVIRIVLNGVHIVDYKLDFEVGLKDERRELVEVKGNPARTPLWRLKWKLLNAMFKDDPMTVLRLVEV